MAVHRYPAWVRIRAVPRTSKVDPFTMAGRSATMPIASIDELHVGQVVDVAARTGPGMNKLGGAARVTAIHSQMNAVDIKCASIASERWSQVYDRSRPCRYMLDNRTEKKLDLQCVSCRSTCTVSSCGKPFARFAGLQVYQCNDGSRH